MNKQVIGIIHELPHAPRPIVNFWAAKLAMDEGKRVSNIGWNNTTQFVFKQVPSSVPAEIVEKMTSLPDSVKAEFIRRRESSTAVDPTIEGNDGKGRAENQDWKTLRYMNQYAIVKPNNEIHSWVPSVADINSELWIILD